MELSSSEVQKFPSYLRLYTDNIRFKDLIESLTMCKSDTSSANFTHLLETSSVSEMNQLFKVKDFSQRELFDIKDAIIQNITYSSLRTAYIDNLSENCLLAEFENIFSIQKKVYVSLFSVTNQAEANRELYYNQLLETNISEYNKIYIPAIYRTNDQLIFFFAYKYSDKEETDRIIAATTIISLNKGTVETHVKNEFTKANSSEVDVNSTEKFYYSIKKILKELGLELKPRKSSDERKALFDYCKYLNKAMIEDYEESISKELGAVLKPTLDTFILQLNTQFPISGDAEKRILKKIESIYVGEYITKMITSRELREKALEKGLKGYPTKIKYTNKDAANSQTASKGKNEPLPVHEIFHSINTVFEDMSVLREIRIAWFERFTFATTGMYERKASVNQTMIKSTKNYLRVVFASTSKTNKEMVDVVLSEIRRLL
ncbi:hypothetical protein [Enterococcus sp. BWR-S5]|uniref:hypothetical protein n=1 Tax=Enterococcus sp. BWR-S5 TaxID=2787714 RepID=UPI00192143AF|nr:hypothetical protein [Enterococcus sp. BWR-S5]MBL1225548.1 hypothetical protein [Enterococcus sp. BWR-S5]